MFSALLSVYDAGILLSLCGGWRVCLLEVPVYNDGLTADIDGLTADTDGLTAYTDGLTADTDGLTADTDGLIQTQNWSDF
jgi:hypothetical protein